MSRFARVFSAACILMALAPAASRAASVVPSIEITSISANSANTCSGSTASVNILLNNPGVESDNYEIYSGSTLLYRWTGETYSGVGPNTYGLQSNSFPTLPANSPLTAIIYTFPTPSIPAAPYTAAEYSYTSAATWNCTTGALISIVNSTGGTVAQVPAVQPAGLALMALGLAALGALGLARRTVATRGKS